MHLVLVGLNFDTARVALRERIAFQSHQLPQALQHLKESELVREGLILSTCNRVEVYVATDEKLVQHTVDFIKSFFSVFHDVPLAELDDLFILTGNDVVTHLFSVASSMKSMILGETQIQSQIKQAAEIARKQQSIDFFLINLFQQALAVGKRVRRKTSISQHSLSVSHAAVTLLNQELKGLADKNVCIVGLGKMSMLAIEVIHKYRAGQICIINRSIDRARALEQKYSVAVHGFDKMETCLVEADAVITSTSAPKFVISKEIMDAVMQRREGRNLVIVDIAVPRDVEPEVNGMAGLRLFDIDDLNDQINSNRAKRAAELEKVQSIVAEEVARYERWVSSLAIKPLIRNLKTHAEQIRELELRRALRKMDADLSESDSQLLHDLTCRIVNKMLHTPIVRLRHEANSLDDEKYATTVKNLFGIDTA